MKTEKFDHLISILDDIEGNDIFNMFGAFRSKEYSPNEFASYLCDLYYAVESAANEIEYTLCEVTNPGSYSETIINKVARTAMSYRPNTFLNLLNIFDINDIDSYSENEIDEIIDNATSWMSVVNLQQCIWLSASLELFAKIRTPFSRNGIDISSILAKHEELFYEEDILYVDPFYSDQGVVSINTEIELEEDKAVPNPILATKMVDEAKPNKSKGKVSQFEDYLTGCDKERIREMIRQDKTICRSKNMASLLLALHNLGYINIKPGEYTPLSRALKMLILGKFTVRQEDVCKHLRKYLDAGEKLKGTYDNDWGINSYITRFKL